MKVGAIIQARMGSTRLPGKIIKKLEDKTVLQHVIERIKQSQLIDTIIIATTTHERDNVVEKEAIRCGVSVFRGSENDVLSRYYFAAKENNLDVIVRVTSDCPLIDPHLTDNIIKYYINSNYQIVSNAGSDPSNRTYPRGLDVEVFSQNLLEDAFINAKEKYHREHVTPYLYEQKKVYYYKNNIDFSKFRWTLDTEDDLNLIKEIYKNLYNGKHDFFMDDIIDLFNKNQELFNINSHIEQKKLRS